MAQHKAEVSQKDLDALYAIMEEAIQKGRAFFVAIQGTEGVLVAASEEEGTIEFLKDCMEMDKEVMTVILEAASKFLWDRLQRSVCPDCPDKSKCDGYKSACVPAGDLEQRLHVLKNLIRDGKN
jgi:hypothetical protein